MIRLFKYVRPDDVADELHFYVWTNHECQAYKDLIQKVGREKAEQTSDLVCFPMGHYGMGLPAGKRFIMFTTEPCPACGQYLRAAGEWKTTKVFDFGAKPKG